MKSIFSIKNKVFIVAGVSSGICKYIKNKKISVLINNAGINKEGKNLDRNLLYFDEIMNIN